MWPNAQGRPPTSVVHCGTSVAEWLDQAERYDREALIVRGAYSNLPALYGDLPTSRDAALNAYLQQQLGPLDAFLFFGQVSSVTSSTPLGSAYAGSRQFDPIQQ